ncbi:MAG: oligosaccharide flippase family protein [Candidatus Omnitrophota bacterium]
MRSKAKILFKGSLLRTFYFFSSALIGLFLMPFMIRSLRDELYGMWMFIASLLGFYLLFDMGLSSATQRYVSRAIGKDDHKEANAIVNTSFFLFATIGIFVLFLSLGLAYILPLVLKKITNVSLFRVVMIILGVNLAVTIPMRTFSGILMSHLRFDIQTLIELFKLFLRAALVILVLKLGHSIIAVALVFCFSDLLGYTLFYIFARKTAPYIRINAKSIDKTKITSLYSYSWKTLVAQAADKLRFDIDNFVIVGFLGLNSVTIYVIAARLTRHFIDLISSITGIFTPVFSQYEGRGDFHSIREKFILMTRISSYLAIFVGGIIIIFGKAFIERWMGPQYLEAYPLLVVLTIPLTIALMQSPSIQLLFGISKHNFFAIFNSIEGVANLILSLILVRKFGLMGVALGTAIPMIIVKIFIQPIYTCKIIQLSVKDYYLQIFGKIVVISLTIMVFFWLIVNDFIIPTYLRLFLLFISGLILTFSGIFYLGFTRVERKYFQRIILGQEIR